MIGSSRSFKWKPEIKEQETYGKVELMKSEQQSKGNLEKRVGPKGQSVPFCRIK